MSLDLNSSSRSKGFLLVITPFLSLALVFWLALNTEQQSASMRQLMKNPTCEKALNFSCDCVSSPHPSVFKESVDTTANEQYLDFFIMGFPKCGTTSLMILFNDIVNETRTVPKLLPPTDEEPNPKYVAEYSLKGPRSAEVLVEAIKENAKLFPDVRKFGIKWPTALVHPSVITDLASVDSRHKKTKIIIGFRHPVRWFESFYNFRLRGNNEMPPPNNLIGGFEVNVGQIHTDFARYERYFMQFGKIDLTLEELGILSTNLKPHGSLLSIPNEIFLYSLEQIEDDNSTRADVFWNDLKTFMNLDQTITSGMFPKVNAAPKVNVTESGKKLINICDDAYKETHRVLSENAKVTADWFRSRLFDEKRNDLVIGGRDHFFSVLETWKQDPCVSSN